MNKEINRYEMQIITNTGLHTTCEEAVGFYVKEGSIHFFDFSDDGNYYQRCISVYPVNRTIISKIRNI